MPTRIFWCSRDGEITAVQVWYGGYDPLAGVLHGTLNKDDYCTEDILDAENIEEVTIYHDSISNPKRVVGIKIKQRTYTDVVQQHPIIAMGATSDDQKSQTGHYSETVTFPIGNDQNFWGF